MSSLLAAVDVPFPTTNLSQIYSSQLMGNNVTVFSLSWLDDAQTTSYDGYLAMRHLGDGQVEFGEPLITPTVEWGPHYVYDDIFVDTKGLGAASGLATFKINPDLSIVEVEVETTHDWVSPPLVNLQTHDVFNFTDTNVESFCHKVSVAPDGTISGLTQTWNASGSWDFNEECTRISDTVFIDAVYYEEAYPGWESWWEDLVFIDLANGGTPTIGTLTPPAGMPAGGGWSSPVYVNSTARPTTDERFLITQSGGGVTLLCEMRRVGNSTEVLNTYDVNATGFGLRSAYWSTEDKALVEVENQTDPYPMEFAYDVWGSNERYTYDVTGTRRLTGTAPDGPCPDGGFFAVHELNDPYPAPNNAMIRVFYVPQTSAPNRIGWGILAS